MAKSVKSAAKPVNFFAKAVEAAPPKEKKARKQTTWVLAPGENAEAAALSQDIHSILEDKSVMDARKTTMVQAMSRVCKFALASFCNDVATNGYLPETPMSVSNAAGESVTFVVQDKCGTAALTEEAKAALEDLLGEEAAAELIEVQTDFVFNNDLLAEDGVQEALSEAFQGLVAKGKLTEEQAGALITAKTVTRVKKGTVQELGNICGKNKVLLQQIMGALNGPIVTYVKA